MDIRSVSGPGNVDPYKSGDPGLQAALAAATTIEQDFPLACERALGKLLVNEINSLIGQGGTLKDFQGWLSNNDLLFQGPSYFGVTETDVLYIYDKVAQKSTAPTFTPMDDLMDQFATWLNTDSVVANTPNFQLAITMGFYPPTTPALFAQYCTQIADEGGSPFANFGDLIDHPDEIYKFASLSGAPMELTWVKAMAQAQVANTTGDDKAFFQSIVTELNKCSTLADFQAWVKTTYGVQDAYMQNPGVDASLIEQFYFLAGTPTAATTLDTDFSKLYAALSGTSYKDALLAQISALGSNGTEAQFAALFSKYDLYWQYPSLSGDDVAKIDACFHQTPAGITDMDTALREAIAWKDQASGEAQQLATDLYNEILHDCNSQTPMKGGALSAWLTQNFGTYDIYWNYPGLTETDAQNFFSICKIDPVSETPMDKAYFAAQTWLQGHSNTDPAYAFIQNLLSQITSEGSFQDPTAFLAQFTLTHDIYWQNTTFTEQDGLDIYAICQAKTPPAFTDMDNALREVLAWLATPNLSDPAKQLAATLYMEISSNCNSQTPMKGGTLSDWIAQKFSTDDIYWTYPGLTEDEASNFFSICRIGTVKDNDIDQVHAFLVSWTPGTSAGAQLRSDLIAYIDGLNSGTSPQTFTDFVTKMFVKCDASWLYPGISSDDITALNAGCKLSLGEETDMDKAYFAVQAWLTANPAAGPMRDFVAQFFTQIKAAGSYPSVTTTLLAPYSSPPNNDMYWQEPQLTKDNVEEIYTLLQQKEPPKFTDLDGVYRMTLTWMGQVKQSDPAAYQLALDLKAELDRRGSNGGSLAEWKTWIQTTLLGQDDVYWKYPGIIDTDVTSFETQYGITGQEDLPMDKAYAAAQFWINTHPSSDPAYGFMRGLLQQIEGLGSYQPMSTLMAQFGPPNNDIYWQHPQFTPQDISDVYAIFQQQTVPGVTDTDKAYFAAENWLKANPAAGSMHDFVYALSQQIEALGSYKGLDSILNQFQPPNNDFYWQHPDLQGDANTIYQILQQQQAPGMSPMDTAYFGLQAWLQTSPTGDDLALANALKDEFESLHSYNPLSDLTNWAQNFINSNSPIYNNASANAVQTFLNITGAVDTSFSKIQTDIQAYLAAETAAIAEIETMMRLRAPPNAAQARQFETYLNNMIATYGTLAVASRYGISVTTLNTVLQELPVAGSYSSSNALFTAALAEIAELEKDNGSLSALKAWAQSVNLSNYPGLSAADLAEFQKLLNLP